MEYEIDYTDLDVSPWGGLALLRQMLNQCGFRAALESCVDLPRPGSNRGHDVAELVESFIVSVWCGANRFIHTEVTRQDEALRKVFGWKRVAGNDAYKRFFGKFGQATNQRVSDHLFGWHFGQLRFDDFTLDMDYSVVTRYGLQEGAQKGYNPVKRGCRSHHPLMAFVADCNMVTNMKLPPAEVWRLYRGRANAENRIKELKYDFGMDSFCLRNFFGTEAALTCCMVAYNLMSLFRMAVLKGETNPRMTTLRYKIFAVGAYFETKEQTEVLKLALRHARREWISGLWDASKKVSLPFVVS